MMNEIIDPERGVYREDSIFTNSETGMVPNWLIMFKMQECYFCDVITPTMDILAREFNFGKGAAANYKVAIVDCSDEASLFMCQYLHITKVPKFIVLHPSAITRFFQFPSAYNKNVNNLFRFAVQEWPEAYTQHDFVLAQKIT